LRCLIPTKQEASLVEEDSQLGFEFPGLGRRKIEATTNPGGLPKEIFDGFQAQLAANRSQFYYDVAAGPFYGYNRPGAKPSQGVIWNWWRQGYDGRRKGAL
jgi:hypothetical protein